MDNKNPITLSIRGVSNLISSGINKLMDNKGDSTDGVIGDYIDELKLNMDDVELIKLKTSWEGDYTAYNGAIKAKQDLNKLYYLGRQNENNNTDKVVATNLIFEAEETFIPQALSKNPEPVVWSDNTDEGKTASNDIKTMLQYHADVLCLRRNLAVMVRHWSIYYLGIIKHGWDNKEKDIMSQVRKPQNFIFDKDGYIDSFGNFKGEYLGEKIESSAKSLIESYPKYKEYITEKVKGKLGTKVVRTEWWTDDYCFITFYDQVLDKYKNPYFNYETKQTDEFGIETATPGINHFSNPKMPYTFLSVFSLQERPHDVTNLIEQSIPNQDRIVDRDIQISKNLAAGNNAIVLSGISFNTETAHTAARAIENGSPILSPNGDTDAVKRLPANDIPSAVFNSQENDKEALRSIFGTSGLASTPQDENTTARGMILNQSHDSSRIGGGIGDAIEQVADNIFNWWLQLYYVFYDETHYASIMGNGHAVEYVELSNADLQRHFVVSVSAGSMQPKDEITEQNLALQLYQQRALDPITLFQKLNYPDPLETAKKVAIWTTNPQLYMQMFFPESAMSPDSANPQIGQQPEQMQGNMEDSLSAPPANASLSQVPISTNALPQ